MIDNATLLVAIAFSSGALMLTLLLNWFNARRESYLVIWASGMGCIIVSLTALGLSNGRYDLWDQVAPYAALISGIALVHYGTAEFFSAGSVRLRPAILLWATLMVGTVVPFLFGLSGIGTIMLNLACTLYMVLCGYRYWKGRAEATLPLISGAILFVLTGLSFLACAILLALGGQWVLTAPPNNWAEEVNSIMAIVGLTGLGALSLALNQYRATRRHRHEAETDSLTGLLNRRALFDRFDSAELPTGTAVLMFDIDHFKLINDRQGHAAGDVVIRRLAAILQHNLREADSVARIGGEEFCAVLQPIALEKAKTIAERIRMDFEAAELSQFPDHKGPTVSIGVATCGVGENFSSVLSRADAALYKAKHNGRNRVTTAPLRRIA